VRRRVASVRVIIVSPLEDTSDAHAEKSTARLGLLVCRPRLMEPSRLNAKDRKFYVSPRLVDRRAATRLLNCVLDAI